MPLWLGLFLISNLTVFGAIVNRFDSLISISSVSSLVYRNATDVCALIFYPASLLNSCRSCNKFEVESFGFSTESITSSAKSERLSSSLRFQMPFISVI